MTHITDKTELLEKAFRDATVVGKAWARYGLGVSKAALETSAQTLHKAAEFLNEVSTRFQPPAEPAPAETPAAAKPEDSSSVDA